MNNDNDDNSVSKKSYTAELSYDHACLKSRTTVNFCLLNMAPSSRALDKCLGCVSVFTGGVCLSAFMLGGCVALLPSMAFSRLMGWPSFVNRKDASNLSTSVGSITAIKTLNARSQFARQGSGGPDHLAPQIMDQLSLFGENIPGSQLFTKVFNLIARWNFYLTGRIYVDQIAALGPIMIGEQAFLQVRTCWLDDCVETFVRKNTSSNMGSANVNVVILGAGFDTRCYRLNLVERGVSTFEVDAPGTHKVKLRVLKQAGIDVGPTKFVSCDFETEDWFERLHANGFDATKPTFFVWEGVTPYISKDVVTSTLNKVSSKCAKGSCIGFDYMDRAWALSPKIQAMTKRGGEPWLFGMTRTEPEKLADECGGLQVWDHLHYKELIKRYLAKHYDGRPIGYLEDFGGLLLLGSN